MNTKEIKKLMVEHGITNKEMAERLGVTATHFSAVLNGKRAITLGTADKIQKELGIPDEQFAFYFMNRDGSK